MKSTKTYWLKSGLYTFIERFSVLLFGFGGVYLLLRAFSKDEFGIWALFLSITAFIEVARNGLIQNALVKYLSACKKEEYAAISSASLMINILLTGLSVLFLISCGSLLALWLKSPELQQMLYIYVFTTIALIPFSQFNFLQQANFDFKGIFWSNFIRQGMLFVYIFVGYFTAHNISLITLVWAQVVAAFGGALVSIYFARPYIKMNWQIDRTWINTLFHFGKFVFGTNLGSMIYRSIDKMMIGGFLSTGAVALYDLATRINNLMEIPISSVAAIVFPQSAKKMKEEGKESIKELYEKSVAVTLALILPVMAFILLFPEWIILFIAGEKYLDAVPVLRITILYTFFMPFLRQAGVIFDSIGKPKYSFYILFVSIFVNAVLNFALIQAFGIMGAAYGTLLSVIFIFIIGQCLLYKELRINALNAFWYAGDFYKMGFIFALKNINSFSKKYFSKKKFAITKTEEK